MKKSLIAGALACAFQPVFAEELPIFDLGTLVVTPQRFSAPRDQTPASISVITREEIQNSPFTTVPDLLARQAGISVQDLYGNNAANSSIDLRGFGAAAKQNTLILLDGKRISDIDLSVVQWASIPMDSIDRIEIVRGSGAVLYGEGATNGVINIVTRKPAGNGTQGTVSLAAGSFDTTDARARLSYRAGAFGLSVAANDYRSDGYRQNNRDVQQNLLTDLHLDSGIGEWSLRLGADRQDLRLPGARRIQPSSGLNEYANPTGAQTPLDWASRDGNNVALGWNNKLGNSELSAELAYRTKNQKSYFDFEGFPDYRDVNLSVLSFTPRAKFAHRGQGGGNELIVGIDFHHWDYDLKKSNAPGNIGAPINHVTAKQDTLGWYAQDQLTLGQNTMVSFGARIETLNINANDIYDANAPGGGSGSAAPAGSQHARQTALDLGIRQRLSPQLSAFAKLGRSYRFANVDETYESDASYNNSFQFLRPQWALDRQLGMEYQQGATHARIALFHTDVKDEIHLDPYSTGIGNTNLPPSRRYGLELDGGFKPAEQWKIDANYAYNVGKFKSGTVTRSSTVVSIAGKNVPLVARHKLNLSTVWTPDKFTTLALSASYTAKQYMDNDEPNDLGVKIPAYTVVDAKLTRKFGPLTAGFAINNLLDEKYYTYAVRSNFTLDRYAVYPLPGRTYRAELSYAF